MGFTLHSVHYYIFFSIRPTIKVTLNSGLKMPSWFDLKSLDASSDEDEPGIKKAAETVHALINGEIHAGMNAYT